MTYKQYEELSQRLLPDLPGFAVKKDLLFIKPIGSVLRAFHFDGSAFNKESFSVRWIFMPLYVLSEHLDLGMGDPVRNGMIDGWSSDDPNLEASLRTAIVACVHHLRSLQTPSDIVEAIRPRAVLRPRNSRIHEPFAYSLIKAGDYVAAAQAIDFLLAMLTPDEVKWELEIQERALLMREKLARSPEEALEQLEAWKIETLRHLKLEAFR